MESYMQDQLTDDMINQAAVLYQVNPSKIALIGGFENFVYEFENNGESYILRFVHSNHRSFDQVLAELEFIEYLSQNNASVSTVIHSVNDNIVERIDINDSMYFTISVFEKAPGTYVAREDVFPSFWNEFGKQVGRLHRLTKTFHPKHKRIHWYEENFEDIAYRALGEEDQSILDLFLEVKAKIMALSRTVDNYGLIHTDLHFHNIYYHEGSFTFFDFDDSSYKHFISDIAIIIYYCHMHRMTGENAISNEEYQNSVKYLLDHFMYGYRLENDLDIKEFHHLNEFLLLRSVVLYIVLVAAGYKDHEDPRYRKHCERSKQIAVNQLMNLDLEYVLRDL